MTARGRAPLAEGERFGHLVVIAKVASKVRPSGRLYGRYSVRCDCGVTKEVDGQALVSGNTLSCGCKRDEQARRQTRVNRQRGTGRIAGLSWLPADHGDE